MAYRTKQLDNGSLRVFDVPLMGPQKLREKQFKVKDINEGWMKKALETFETQQAKGKLPLLWNRHNERNKAAEVIGRLDNLRIEHLDGEPWLYADVLITDEVEIEKFLKGKSPSKSVEFQPDNYYLRGLALLDGQEGHFDYGIPDFVPEGLYDELKALGMSPEAGTVLCHSKANQMEGPTMDFTLDDVKAAITEVVAPITERLNKIEQKVGMGGEGGQPPAQPPQAPAGGANMNRDVEDDLKAIKSAERDRYNAEIAKVKRRAKIDGYAAQLVGKAGLTEKLARKQLESFESEEAMDLYFKEAMKKSDEDVKLGIEREHGDHPDLREEWEGYKTRHNSNISFDEFRDVILRAEFNKDYGNKTVHSVTPTAGLASAGGTFK
jgi:hypothetical protein